MAIDRNYSIAWKRSVGIDVYTCCYARKESETRSIPMQSIGSMSTVSKMSISRNEHAPDSYES